MSTAYPKNWFYPFIFAWLSFLWAGVAVTAHADDLTSFLSEIPWKVGLSVRDAETGNEVVGYNQTTAFTPASTMKLFTSVSVLTKLSPSAQFMTRLWIPEEEQGKTEISELYVQSEGDPSFTTEGVFYLVRELVLRGVKKIKKVSVSAPPFQDTLQRSGERAYESLPTPFSLNFNAFALSACPGTAVKESARLDFDPIELEYPLHGKIITSGGEEDEVSLSVKKEKVTVSGRVGNEVSCVKKWRAVPNPQAYFEKVFLRLLKTFGITAPQTVSWKEHEVKEWIEYGRYTSRPLSEILYDMNHYSNNFLAESFVYLLGQQERGFSYQKGISSMREILESLKVSNLTLLDGSGYSQNNKVTPSSLSALLIRVEKDPRVGAYLQVSLPEPGSEGTLRKRAFHRVPWLKAKTGSLDGVSALSGYFLGKSQKKYGFTLFQNSVHSREKAHEWEERVLERLAQQL